MGCCFGNQLRQFFVFVFVFVVMSFIDRKYIMQSEGEAMYKRRQASGERSLLLPLLLLLLKNFGGWGKNSKKKVRKGRTGGRERMLLNRENE